LLTTESTGTPFAKVLNIRGNYKKYSPAVRANGMKSSVEGQSEYLKTAGIGVNLKPVRG
jgi:hypothetical protein